MENYLEKIFKEKLLSENISFSQAFDKDSIKKIQSSLKYIFIDSGINASIIQFISILFKNSRKKPRKVAFICDEMVLANYGIELLQTLKKHFEILDIIPPDDIYADDFNAGIVSESVEGADLIISFGSGTITDLAKIASAKNEIPHIAIASAPSMNGYVTGNSSILQKSHKKSIKSKSPEMILMDLDVMCKAPLRMISAGYADFMCHTTARADWLLSHYLFFTTYSDKPFLLIQDIDRKLAKVAHLLTERNQEAIKYLCEALILSGIGMIIADGSYPASQGEHLIAHYIETFMNNESVPQGEVRAHLLHGELIAPATITAARIQEKFLNSKEIPEFKYNKYDLESVRKRFGAVLIRECSKEMDQKSYLVAELEPLNKRVKSCWKDYIERVRGFYRPASEIEELLLAAGCIVNPKELEIPEKLYLEAINNCVFLRNRFNFLDLAFLTE